MASVDKQINGLVKLEEYTFNKEADSEDTGLEFGRWPLTDTMEACKNEGLHI